MGRGKGRDRGLESRWRGLLREQSRSGWSVRQFCAVHGLRESSFYFWRRELQRRRQERSRSGFLPPGDGEARSRRRRPGANPSTARPSDGVFLPVVVSPAQESSVAAEPTAPIEIVLADAVVRVPAQFDADSLARVVRTLRSASASVLRAEGSSSFLAEASSC